MGAAQVYSIGQKSQRLGSKLQFHAIRFSHARPGKSSLLEAFRHHPKPSSVPIVLVQPLIVAEIYWSGARKQSLTTT
jgi:hypothetical protein